MLIAISDNYYNSTWSVGPADLNVDVGVVYLVFLSSLQTEGQVPVTEEEKENQA